jgi:hypothetical protein
MNLLEIKAAYPFLQSIHIIDILNYYSKEKLENKRFFTEELVEECMAQFISTVDSEVISEKNILITHDCLLDTRIYVKKKYAIEYFGYIEESFELLGE